MSVQSTDNRTMSSPPSRALRRRAIGLVSTVLAALAVVVAVAPAQPASALTVKRQGQPGAVYYFSPYRPMLTASSSTRGAGRRERAAGAPVPHRGGPDMEGRRHQPGPRSGRGDASQAEDLDCSTGPSFSCGESVSRTDAILLVF